MSPLRRKLRSFVESFKQGQEKGAREAFMEELFNDYYRHRRLVYKMNFIRGIFFGLGSVLGGTIVVGIIVWVLSFFVNFPLIGHFLQNAQNSIDSTQQNR